MIRVMDLPMICSAEKPNRRSAPWFQLVTMPSSVFEAMASSDEETIEARRADSASAFCRLDVRGTEVLRGAVTFFHLNGIFPFLATGN